MRLLLSLILAFLASQSDAFCGFYVARADGDLFNESSRVVFLRDGKRSVLTISSDYRGPASEFALVVPTPSVLSRGQIETIRAETVAHLDAYSAPRLVEYHDEDPCAPIPEPVILLEMAPDAARRRGADALGVTVEAEYAVGIYDIAILSAQESGGLATWLRQEGYQVPDGADRILGAYIGGGMKFFVARINLDRHSAAKTADLPPLRLSFTSGNFMLPLQLGKINADKMQDVLLMTLTRRGRVEAANYTNARIPSNIEVLGFVREVFGQFYRALYDRAALPNAVLTEYAWDMAWCDPCAADPLSAEQLRELGADWVRDDDSAGQDVFVTRLHFRYGPNEFLEDLVLRVTDDRENFQGRYVIRTPWRDAFQCAPGDAPLAAEYVEDTKRRLAEEADTLDRLTGWGRAQIDRNIRITMPERYHF